MPIERLPDTPWHIGYTKKEDDDPRRHKARCIKYTEGDCLIYGGKCHGSSHCLLYAEDKESWEKVYENTRTIEELAVINGNRYKEKIMTKRKQYEEYYDGPLKNNPVHAIRMCPVCNEDLHPSKSATSIVCKYCGATICNENEVSKKKGPVVIVGKRAPVCGKSAENKGVFIVRKK